MHPLRLSPINISYIAILIDIINMQVYGLKPTTETCRYPTRELAANLMKYYRAPDEVTEEYYKNLAMLVCLDIIMIKE